MLKLAPGLMSKRKDELIGGDGKQVSEFAQQAGFFVSGQSEQAISTWREAHLSSSAAHEGALHLTFMVLKRKSAARGK